MRIELASSPLVPCVSPVSIAYRELGAGLPLLVVHGGWGAAFYPFREIPGRRMIVPDRGGYGKSTHVATFPRPFHAAGQAESERFLDALGIDRCALWGHSDGAVIAARMAIAHPDRYSALVLEALHVDPKKPSSRAFFTMMEGDPDGFGPRVAEKLEAEHGADWRTVLREDGRAWRDLSNTPGADLYDGKLGTLRVPTLAIFGRLDPRLEPYEVDLLRAAVPAADIRMIEAGAHSPHSERETRDDVYALVTAFLDEKT